MDTASPTNKKNQSLAIFNTTRTGQQGPTVQDPGGTETPIAVQGQDQT